eukprot:gene6971-9531_t
MTSNWKVDIICDENNSAKVSVTSTTATDDRISSVEYSFPIQLIDNIPYPHSISQNRIRLLDSSVVYRKGDIIVVSYPKCGTTWSEQCILLMLNGGDPSSLNPATKNTYIPGVSSTGKVWLEQALEKQESIPNMPESTPVSLDQFKNIPTRRLIKSHAPAKLFLGGGGEGLKHIPEGVKVIIVSRNPLDACVSSYYHAFNPFRSGWPFDAWASAWLGGFTAHGSWFNWVQDWNKQAQLFPDKAMWIQYENLKADPQKIVSNLADFIEVNLDSELIEKVIKGSSFDEMKAEADEKLEKVYVGVPGHIRKGIVGDWQNHFSEELFQDFKNKFYTEMNGSGLVYSIGDDFSPWTA